MDVNGISFRELYLQEKFNFRKSRTSRKEIEKAIHAGLARPEVYESVFVRQHAYCLILGIRQEDLKSSYTQEYEDC